MLKLFCPHCMKSVSVPDEAAGKETPCPECGTPFPVPARYNPIVPPPSPPSPPATLNVPETVASTAPMPGGYTRSRGFTISPCAVAWIPAISLTAILLLTLTPWVEVSPGGHPVYTQGAWRAITGRPTHSFQLEEFMLKELPAPSVYDRTGSDWMIMLPYILALLLALALAWAERLENAGNPSRLQRIVPNLWPHRHALLAAFAGAALILLTIEATRGFGLERAMHAAVSDKFEAQRRDATTTGDQNRIDFLEGQELAKYGLGHTGWFCLVLGLHGLVLLALMGRVGLERRGAKPPPRIAIHY